MRKSLFTPCLLSFLVIVAAAHALESVDSDPLIHSGYGRELIMRGEYEKGLEQLRRAYLLFPLNPTLKQNLAEGYAAYGHRLFKNGRYEQADDNFVKAQELYPEEATYAVLRGISNYHLKKYDVARHELQQARPKKPDSPEVLYYLGLVYYESDSRQEAVQVWEEALRLVPGRHEIARQLEKARREMTVENGMERSHSSRFDLSYDSGVDSAFAMAILDALEQAASQVNGDLGYFPTARVPVVIYKREDYKTVTASPDWSGGVYDGTIRLPFGALCELTPRLRAVLFHEYAHVVVFELTRGNCPLWLNEGIAEFFGRLQFNPPMAELGKAARARSYQDFRKLETGFNGLSVSQAALAYQQSYAMVNHMVVSYGWHRVMAILARLGNGAGIDSAISEALQDFALGYDALVLEWQNAMARGVATK